MVLVFDRCEDATHGINLPLTATIATAAPAYNCDVKIYMLKKIDLLIQPFINISYRFRENSRHLFVAEENIFSTFCNFQLIQKFNLIIYRSNFYIWLTRYSKG